MKKIAVFLKLPHTDYPFSEASYKQSYTELGQEVTALGGEYYIVRGQETYVGNGKFSKSWQFNGTELVESGEVTADIIFDRGKFASDGRVKTFNEEMVNSICTNKWLSYNLFKEYSPKTWLVRSDAELSQVLNEVATELGVVKPIDGQEGKDVLIDKKDALLSQSYQYPVLVQEFLDSSGGVPGVVEGLHDFRVALINGEIIYSYFRTPPKGSYLANVARGGKFEVIALEKIPQQIREMVIKIDSVMAFAEHRFYGIDFAITPEGPKIIEMNSRLGLLPNSDHEVFITVKKKLAEVLTSL